MLNGAKITVQIFMYEGFSTMALFFDVLKEC